MLRHKGSITSRNVLAEKKLFSSLVWLTQNRRDSLEPLKNSSAQLYERTTMRSTYAARDLYTSRPTPGLTPTKANIYGHEAGTKVKVVYYLEQLSMNWDTFSGFHMGPRA